MLRREIFWEGVMPGGGTLLGYAFDDIGAYISVEIDGEILKVRLEKKDRVTITGSTGIGTGVATQKKVGGAKSEAEIRKGQPIYSGLLRYFPDALLAVAEVSRIGNEQHNPGEPLHWARDKSTDQLDAAVRHVVDRGKGLAIDTDGGRHLAKAAWRILAELQLEIERERQGGA